MSVDYFLDTNIFIYDMDATDKRKQRIAQQLIGGAIESDAGVISYQVVQECLNVFTHKAQRPLTAVESERYLDAVLAPLCRVFPSLSFYRKGLAVKERWRFGFYDSLIVTAALEAGCTTLYTEDLQHDQKVDGLRIVDPFR